MFPGDGMYTTHLFDGARRALAGGSPVRWKGSHSEFIERIDGPNIFMCGLPRLSPTA